MISPVSLEMAEIYQNCNLILSIMFLKNLTGKYLDLRAADYGIVRKEGSRASGEIQFSGTDGTVIPKNTIVATTTGLRFETKSDITINSETTVKIEALKIGCMHNVQPNTITSLLVSIPGVTSLTNPTELTGGTEKEKDEELLNRLEFRIKTPGTSGNATHYKVWCTEVNGIGDAKVFPLHSGNGTVLVVPVTTEKRSPDSTILNNVKNKIAAIKPIGATVTVTAPIEVMIDLDVDLKIDPDFKLSDIKKNYSDAVEKYIKKSVFKVYTMDYYRLLSFFYDIEGVKEVKDFKVNNNKVNINLNEQDIPVLGNINITGGA